MASDCFLHVDNSAARVEVRLTVFRTAFVSAARTRLHQTSEIVRPDKPEETAPAKWSLLVRKTRHELSALRWTLTVALDLLMAKLAQYHDVALEAMLVHGYHKFCKVRLEGGLEGEMCIRGRWFVVG